MSLGLVTISPDRLRILEDAARRVANPDLEAAADALCRFDNDAQPDVAVEGIPCDIHKKQAQLAVNAALRVTEDVQ